MDVPGDLGWKSWRVSRWRVIGHGTPVNQGVRSTPGRQEGPLLLQPPVRPRIGRDVLPYPLTPVRNVRSPGDQEFVLVTGRSPKNKTRWRWTTTTFLDESPGFIFVRY